MHAVDADAARRYASEGFLCPVDALSREEASGCASASSTSSAAG